MIKHTKIFLILGCSLMFYKGFIFTNTNWTVTSFTELDFFSSCRSIRIWEKKSIKYPVHKDQVCYIYIWFILQQKNIVSKMMTYIASRSLTFIYISHNLFSHEATSFPGLCGCCWFKRIKFGFKTDRHIYLQAENLWMFLIKGQLSYESRIRSLSSS